MICVVGIMAVILVYAIITLMMIAAVKLAERRNRKEEKGRKPPYHINCRCLMYPFFTDKKGADDEKS